MQKKRIIAISWLALLGMLFVTACGQSAPTQTESQPANTEPLIVTPENTSDQTAGEAVAETVAVDPNDFSLVGATGNPQFLNSFAVW